MASDSQRITLKGIAQRLGITPRAVSHALRNNGGTTRVAPGTVARVRALAEQEGYRFNSSARALRTQRFKQAGILVRYNFENQSGALVETPAIFGVGDFLNSQKWHLLIVQDQDSVSWLQEVPYYVQEHSLDGFVLISQGPESDELLNAEMARAGVPCIWLNSDAPINAIGIKDEIGGEMATQHLVELGHKRIVFLSVPTTHSSLRLREQGYQNVMRSFGLEPVTWSFPHAKPLSCDYREREAGRLASLRDIVDDLLPRLRPTGIVCYSDLEALMVNRALLTAGYSIPADVSVIGYNDLPLIQNIYPPLTTVKTDFYQMGRMAGEMLMKLIEEPSRDLPSRSVYPQLVVRNSSGAAPRIATPS